jgi:hypothetical protein
MPQVSKGYSLHHAYLNYSKSTRNKAQKFKVGPKKYKEIAQEYLKTIVDLILEDSKEVKLPYNMGEIRIKRSMTSYEMADDNSYKMKVDWKATKELWKTCDECRERKQRVYHLNEHSDGWYSRWFWSKQNVNIKNQSAYSFDPSFTNRRRLAKIMKTDGGYKRYFE